GVSRTTERRRRLGASAGATGPSRCAADREPPSGRSGPSTGRWRLGAPPVLLAGRGVGGGAVGGGASRRGAGAVLLGLLGGLRVGEGVDRARDHPGAARAVCCRVIAA